jgi:cell wall-associated NlpC family hydrolase
VRRLLLISLVAFLAAGLASLVSLTVASEARSQASAPDSGDSPSQGSATDARAPAEVMAAMDPPTDYSQVVDNASPGRFEGPGWEQRPANEQSYGEDYSSVEPSGDVAPARFKVEIPETGYYSVYAWWPAAGGNNAATRFGISTTSGVVWTEVDQRTDGGFWVKLGAYEMKAGDSYALQISPRSGSEGYVIADAVAVVRGTQVSPPEETTGDGVTIAGGRPTGRDVVRVARRYIGTDYRWGTCTRRHMSCTCLTKKVFAKFGHRLPMSEDKQWKKGRRVSNRHPGDLVFFEERGRRRGITHVGIFSGNGNLVHASAYFDRVVESKMKYIRGYKGAKRLSLR